MKQEEENENEKGIDEALKQLQDARTQLVLKATDDEVNALKALMDQYQEKDYTASSRKRQRLRAERLPQLQIRKMLQLLTEKLLCVSAGGEAMPDIRQQRRHVRHLWKNILISR